MKTTIIVALGIALTIVAFASSAAGQTGGGGRPPGGGTGGVGGGGTGGGGTGGGGTGGGGTGGGGTGGGGTGGAGGTGGQFNQQELTLGGNDFRFDDIRRPRFAGVSRATAVHPYTRVGNSEALQLQDNTAEGAGGAAGGGANATQANSRTTGNVAGTNQFSSPFGQFGLGGFGGQFGAFGGFGGLGGQQTPVRSSLSFNTEPSSHLTAPTRQALQAPVLSQPLASRVRSIPGLQGTNVSVQILNRTAIVSGIVKTEEEKQRVARVLKLEPGISEVDNRLEIRP